MEKKSIQIDPENLQKMLTVLDLIVNSKGKIPGSRKKQKDIYSVHAYKNFASRCKSIGRHCIDLAINSISNHRYHEAKKLLWILCQDRTVYGPFIFKFGAIVLSNLECDKKEENILNFFSFIVDYLGTCKKDMLLEFMIQALKNNMQNVKSSVQEFSRLKTSQCILRSTENVHSFYEAYTVLLDYMEWYKKLNDNVVISQSQAFRDEIANSLMKLLNTPGSWDIFVLKLFKVMVFCDMQEEIESSLLLYVEKNPENINAYIYLCTYLYHNNPESEKLLNYLEILAEKSPSDVRVLWLVEILNKSENEINRCLNYILMFLDYPVNGKNVVAWKILWQTLSKIYKNKDENQLKVVNSLWKHRSLSWKWMHFNSNQEPLLSFNDEQLILYKVAALSFLMEGSKYIEKISKVIPDIQEKVNCIIAES